MTMLRQLGVALLILISLASSLIAQAANPSPRIVGGTIVPDDRYPFMVAIYFNDQDDGIFRPGCGGSLISNTWVLTAAHCVNDSTADTIAVLVGALNLSQHNQNDLVRARSIEVHPGYSPTTLLSDIALIELAEPVNQAVISLPATGGNVPTAGDPAVVAGWGVTIVDGTLSDSLRQVALPITSHVQCLLFYKSTLRSDANVCAGGIAAGGLDACQGDSGGPLFVLRNNEYVQAGIVSYGDSCALPHVPGVYTRVATYSDWVTSFVPDAQINNAGIGEDNVTRSLDELQLTQLTATEAVHTGSLPTGQVAAYEINGASKVELLSLTGDADLYIFNGLNFEIEDIQCDSIKGTGLDECDVAVSSERQFAIVFGAIASDYQISASEPAGEGGPGNSLDASNNDNSSNATNVAVLVGTAGVALGVSSGGSIAWPGIALLAAVVMLRRRKSLLP